MIGRQLLGLALGLMLGACASGGKTRADRVEAARIHLQLGVEHLRRGQLSQAEPQLKRAAELDPRSADVQTALGVLSQRLGDAEGAERAFRRALSLNPGDGGALNNLGVLLCEQGRVEEGVRRLVEAANTPRYGTPEAAWTNAAVCIRAQDPGQAEAYLRNALERNPQFADALLQLGALRFARQDFLGARAFLSRLEAQGPMLPEALLLRARTERALGDAATADRYLQRLRTDFPDSPEAAQAFDP